MQGHQYKSLCIPSDPQTARRSEVCGLLIAVTSALSGFPLFTSSDAAMGATKLSTPVWNECVGFLPQYRDLKRQRMMTGQFVVDVAEQILKKYPGADKNLSRGSTFVAVRTVTTCDVICTGSYIRHRY